MWAKKNFILSAGWGLIKADFLAPDYDITFSSQADAWKRRNKRDVFRDFAQMTQAELSVSEPIYFFGGKDYLPLYYKLTRTLAARKVIYFVAATSRGSNLLYKRYHPGERTGITGVPEISLQGRLINERSTALPQHSRRARSRVRLMPEPLGHSMEWALGHMKTLYVGDARDIVARICTNHGAGNVEASALRCYVAQAMGLGFTRTRRPSGSTRLRIKLADPRMGERAISAFIRSGWWRLALCESYEEARALQWLHQGAETSMEHGPPSPGSRFRATLPGPSEATCNLSALAV